MSNQPNTSVQLSKPTDWPVWYRFIRRHAKQAGIWDYVKPDTELGQDKTRKTINIPETLDEQNENWQQLLPLYQYKFQQYSLIDGKIKAFQNLLLTTIGANYEAYIDDEIETHKIISVLEELVKPSQSTLRKTVLDLLERRKQGPKRLSVAVWLQLHLDIIQMGKQIKPTPAGTDELSVEQAFLQDCEQICPVVYSSMAEHVIERSEEVEPQLPENVIQQEQTPAPEPELAPETTPAPDPELPSQTPVADTTPDLEIYLTPPQGSGIPLGTYLHLRKALYSLRKSPKLWFLELSAVLRSFGLTPVPDKPCLFVHPEKLIFVFFYVDDILIISKPDEHTEMEQILEKIQDHFEIRRMEEFSSFLNTRVALGRQQWAQFLDTLGLRNIEENIDANIQF
ncbi:hypothetical protein DV735_g5972, partial [Chaetothyriales sp. CBS 134920]